MYKKLIAVLCIVGCVALLTGCGKEKQEVTSANIMPEATSSAAPAPTAASDSAKQLELNLFYGNEEGDALVSKTITLEQTPEEPLYLDVLNRLTVSPDEQNVALFAGFTFQSAVLEGTLLTIDLTLPQESLLGAPGEELLLESLQKTMFQFNEIQSIEVLVNGKKVESLLGHMDLPHPIVR